MRRIRSKLKLLVLATLYYSGLLWLLAAMRLRRRALVLTYHRVLPKELQSESFSSPGIIVTPETFDLHMRFLRRHMNPVSVHELARVIESGSSPRWGTCLVTFDDGWYDNLEYALPILRRHGIPAVLFIATDFIGTGRCFWQERLARQLYSARRLPAAQGLYRGLGLQGIETMRERDARDTIRELVTDLKGQPPGVVDRLFADLETFAPYTGTAGADRFLNWTELAELTKGGLFSIGSHAVSHTPLTQLAAGEVQRELAASKDAIRAFLGTDVDSVAYPNGDANPEVADHARHAGYAIAFTTERGLVEAGLNPRLLPRINIHESAAPTPPAFLGRLLGVS